MSSSNVNQIRAFAEPDIEFDIIKRLLDIFFPLAGIIVLSPFLSLVAILIKLDSKGPVFFKQERIGLGFEPFTIIKFRTMEVDACRKGPLVTSGGDRRITKIGRLLRRTKIDELPQLLNVLKGDMSLVGPRPEVGKYVNIFRYDYWEVLKVRPGITDFASLEYCDEEEALKKYADPEEGYIKEILPAKIVLYKKYLSEKGLLTDIKLIFLTLSRVISTR